MTRHDCAVSCRPSVNVQHQFDMTTTTDLSGADSHACLLLAQLYLQAHIVSITSAFIRILDISFDLRNSSLDYEILFTCDFPSDKTSYILFGFKWLCALGLVSSVGMRRPSLDNNIETTSVVKSKNKHRLHTEEGDKLQQVVKCRQRPASLGIILNKNRISSKDSGYKEGFSETGEGEAL